MNKKDIRKLSRKDLLEIMLNQSEKIKSLELEISKLKEDLASKNLSISNAGTLAEASISISGIFQKADEAIEIYKNNYIDQIRKDFEKEKEAILKETKELCKKNEKASKDALKKAKEKAKIIVEEAKKDQLDLKNKKKDVKKTTTKSKKITSKK